MCADGDHRPIGDLGHDSFARQIAPRAFVEVLDSSFLPRRLGVAEPSFGADFILETPPAGELDAAVEGDGSSRGLGQGGDGRHQPVHQMPGAAVVVAEQDGVAGLAFHQGRDVGQPMLSPENHQITFPVAKDGALFDPGWTVLDGALGRKHKALRASCKARPALPSPVGQVAGQFGCAPFAAVDMA